MYTFVPDIHMVLNGNTPPTDPITDGYGHDDDELDPISSHSLSLTSSLDKTDGRSSQCIADKSKTSQPVLTHNEFYSTPDIKMTIFPTAYTPPPIFSLSTLLTLKHHWYHPPYA